MSQNDLSIANQTFPATRTDLNSALQAIASKMSATAAPSTTYPHMWYMDTTAGILYFRDTADAGWTEAFYHGGNATGSNPWVPYINGTLLATLGEAIITASNAAAVNSLLGLGTAATGDIGTDVQAYDADTMFSDTTATLSVGYSATPYDMGTVTNGTVNPTASNGPLPYLVNGGDFALGLPQTATGGVYNTTVVIEITNNSYAGTITATAFAQTAGDSFTTTDGDVFLCEMIRHKNTTLLNVVAQQ